MSNNHNKNLPNSLNTFDSDVVSVDSNATRTSSHLTFAQIRGLVKLFNYYFVNKDASGRTRRLPRQELNKRWVSYKKKVFEDYGKVVKGTLNSEKAFVKRYSEPLSFLKYKLKRAKNLRVTDLSEPDQAYYFEIGGTENVDSLIQQQMNVDSVDKVFNVLPTKRRRLNPPDWQILSTQSSSCIDYADPLLTPASLAATVPGTFEDIYPPATSVSIQPKRERGGIYTQALNNLDQKLTQYEQEQLEKKKSEINALFSEKCQVIMDNVNACLNNRPELIGFIPFCPAEEQVTNAFDNWLHEQREMIRNDVADISTFFMQISTLRGDERDWRNFVHIWKLHRIFFNENDKKVWDWVVQELNVEVKSDKEEAD